VLVPEPVVVVPPGERVSVQVPVAGSPVNITLPVETLHEGWVMDSTTGAVGVAGWGLIVTVSEGGDTQPIELVTVKLYDPEVSPVIVRLVVDPVMLPGLIVQVPEGRPLSTTLPVATSQVGWVIAPTVGAATDTEVMVPPAEAWVHVPVVVKVNGKVPATVGVPLIVNCPPLYDPVTPAGRPVTPAPVPPPPMV